MAKVKVTDDPVQNQSLSVPLLVSTLVLMLTLVWALYDELYALRPWKGVQTEFIEKYGAFLKNLKPAQGEREQQIQGSAEYQEIQAELQTAQETISDQLRRLGQELSFGVIPRMTAVRQAFQLLRSEIDSYKYRMEVSGDESEIAGLQAEIDEIKARVVEVDVLLEDGSGEEETLEMNYDQLFAEFERLQTRRTALQAERVELMQPIQSVRSELTAYRDERLFGLTQEQIDSLLASLDGFEVEIKQIHIAEVDLVDRCESCHLGIREPVEISAAAIGDPLFASHPNPDLFAIHNPEEFGCTPCHQGNGRATSSVEKAHGRYKHWLWPLYEPENTEAGCHQCHAKEVVTVGAETLNEGRELFLNKGCWGCHRFEGFDREADQLQTAGQELSILSDERAANEKERRRMIELGDTAEDNEAADRAYEREEELRLRNSRLDARMFSLRQEINHLEKEVKKFGPNLKEIKVKVRKEWLPVWVKNPHEFRPGSKMPVFRLLDDEVQAISAYLWQNAVEGELEEHPHGNVERGQELFETRGCMGCHSMGEGEAQQGGDFAANLSRVGEKTNYNFLVRWIHDPHELTPDPDAGPDEPRLTPMMPSLRLSWQDARDIASYLMAQKTDAEYAAADYLDDPALAEKGLPLLRHYGCAGCHLIKGLEEEGRIGTELTLEGSKPVERLDFALFGHDAKHEGWYNHKGFFERKLKNPAFFDQGKVKEHLEKLKMPNFNLSDDEIQALTTFLLGAVDTALPASMRYEPEDAQADVQNGWWLIKRYNCNGCHQIRHGDVTSFMTMERYQDPDWVEQMPPQLYTQGARVKPAWLMHFLDNPSMSESSPNKNGVREYLHARMPSFGFSDRQVGQLMRFFMARSAQPLPHFEEEVEPLTQAERVMSRRLFSGKAAPCLKCHATGEAAHDRNASAPNFLLAADRLKPDWTYRWMLDPQQMAPGTAMPSDLFRREHGRWVFDGTLPAAFEGYEKDHAQLLVRYMFQFTPDELRRLRASAAQ